MRRYQMFTTEEYAARLAKIQTGMDKAGLDGLILTKATNIVYVSGYRTSLFDTEFRPFFCIVPKQGNPTLVVPLLEVGGAVGTAWFDDIRGWGSTPGNLEKLGLRIYAEEPVALMQAVASEKGMSQGRIGIEMDVGQRLGMTLKQFQDLQAGLPDATFVDASTVMWSVRKVKSPREMELIQEACRITDAAVMAARDFIRVGVTEKEIAAVIGRTMIDEGAENPEFVVVTTGKDRYRMMNPYPTDTKTVAGDVVLMDVGATYEGYVSDISRQVFVGEPSKLQREFYQAEIAIYEAGANAAKPGVTVSAVDRAVFEKVKEIGYMDYLLHRTGHSLALDVHELPSVAPGDDTVLDVGTVITIEPGLYNYEIGGFRIENTGGVTEKGFEVFTKCTYALDDIVK